MCGIAGIIHFDKQKVVDEAILVQMRDSMAHRGPDGCGFTIDNNVGFGHRRLSIIDLSANAQQPFRSSNGLYNIVFNGEIFNYLELKGELIKKGYNFRTVSDTEVLITLYEEYGEQMLCKLNGMFAFAIHDKKADKIFIARDRVGVKPFYYSIQNNTFYFASEPKAIISAGVNKLFNDECRDELLIYRYISGERTIFKHIKRLLPGRSITIQNGNYFIKRWWDLPSIIRENRENLPYNPFEWFEETFYSSVNYRTISDVPVGLMLSGGLDSGSIAVALGYNNQKNISSFNIGFNDKLYDESHLAKLVSDKFDLSFNSMQLEGDQLFDNLIQATWFHDEPLVHQNDAQMLALAKWAKEKVTVLLSGEGGDELMGGYVRYKPLNYYSSLKFAGYIGGLVKNFKTDDIVNRFDKISRYTKGNNLREMTMLNALNVYPNDFHNMGFSFSEKFSRYRLDTQLEAEGIYPKEPARQAMYTDLFIHMSSVLDRNDRMTMGGGIECRVPFLDYRLLEMIPALPSNSLLKGKKGKFLLANSIAQKLPNEVIKFKKLGFSVPWDEYFKKNMAFQEMFENIKKGSLNEFIGEYNFHKNIDPNSEFQKLLMRQLLMLEFWRVYYYNIV